MKKRRESFSESVISLMFSQGIIKVFGLLYSMYLINKESFGDTGNAIYMGGYHIYVLLLTVSSIGVPNSVAKIVAEEVSMGDYKCANRVFKISLIIFGLIGFLGSIILFAGAKIISNNFLLIPECEYGLLSLSPSIFFVAVSSVIRGYFNGIGQISKTAKAQTIEQIAKSILTIMFVEIIWRISKNTVSMASIANFASTCAILISFIYILINYFKIVGYKEFNESKCNLNKYILKEKSFASIIKRVLLVSMPITFAAILGTLNKSIDSVTVVRILTPILGESMAKIRYGMLSSKVDMLTLAPLSFNIALPAALIPYVSSAFAKKDFKTINRKLSFSLLVTSIIAFPSAIGMSIYSNQIIGLLFPNSSSGGDILKISAFCIIFIAFIQTMGGVLHGIGKTKAYVFALSIGLITKLLLNIFLVPITNIYEKGAVIGNLISNIVSFFIIWNILKISIPLDFTIFSIVFKPLFASIIMAFSSYYIYNGLILFGISQNISTILGIIFGIIIYLILIFLLRIFSREEVLLLPNGEKIYEFFKKN